MIDYAEHFLAIALAIAIVAATLKQDRPRAVVSEALKLLVFVVLGVVVFAVFVYVLPRPEYFFG